MKITIVADARPNFMKIAPIIRATEEIRKDILISYRLVHTSQHYDHKMSGAFFDDLNIPKPHNNLGVGSGTQAEQTASIMIRLKTELIKNQKDLVLVVGDVTFTMACTIFAGLSVKNIGIYLNKMISGNWKKSSIPSLWDGKTAIRIINYRKH